MSERIRAGCTNCGSKKQMKFLFNNTFQRQYTRRVSRVTSVAKTCFFSFKFLCFSRLTYPASHRSAGRCKPQSTTRCPCNTTRWVGFKGFEGFKGFKGFKAKVERSTLGRLSVSWYISNCRVREVSTEPLKPLKPSN